MTQINLTKITKTVAGEPLFTLDQLTAHTGERIGIVGANGTGKTTLARIIAGTDTEFTGQRTVTAPVTLVPQIAPTNGRSGGQSMLDRVRRALAQRPEILILDEPSANLDDDHQQWLRDQLQHFSGLLLIISHDRELLTAVATQIWSLSEKTYTQYNGNFADFERLREQQRENELTHYQQAQRERRELKKAIQARHEKANRIRKGSRRMSAAELSNSKTVREQNAGKMERGARALKERMDQQTIASKPHETSALKMVSTDLPPVTGKYLVTVADLHLQRGKHDLLDHVQLRIKPGERVALAGPNGSGKSTLIEAILGHQSGTHLAASARVGYFHQDMTALPSDQTVWQVMSRVTALDDNRTRQIMGAFGLKAIFYDRLIGELSGGEQVKLQLLAILVSASNLLILDEPTNYLDLPALRALEDFLIGYPGTVLFVAHDQTFRQKVATRVLKLTAHRLIDPAKTAQGTPATDLPRLQFEYDQLMMAPQLDTQRLRELREQIVELKK
ncbi:ABC-F family ATP-binding cassette domain-containing protein [Levilactobacillus tujiorum]|uniref:ABC-F family ATP-binding cassette domain-containing protein n=1 Tax=Levilactobacillus tujiorum TaxID=2912243 RepID=A0ABX1L1R3_9LACO|nr:ATP-binding cassette domain-containing protein [Levilactobacillus tujiorum]MCH5463990.1 ATP-binding cassette domain-containing protein [Levilactobacillus tujiorum]NLR11091.1 ABC-F family ATP-binding cassette domain-containing protein [Lactobacillus sp. HBUAS51387]NLR28976.1 ABC-F family ATP-binding cassette domain-containing protein [Levilactobacillus tujiorum]